MRNSIRALVVISILFFYSCGNGGNGPSSQTTCQDIAPSPYALWSEFEEPETIIAQIPSLKNYGISLYQNIRSDHIGDPRTAQLLTQATCSGVEVRAWLTLPEEQGYWPNEKNVDLFVEKASELADWIQSSGWPIEWIVVDMELDLQTSTALTELLNNGDYCGALELLLKNQDPESFAQAAGKYTDMVSTLHGRGFKVMVVTFPMVLDDLVADSDNSIQDLLNIPVAPVPWDELSFMTYTTTFANMAHAEITPYLPYTYGLDAIRFYGDKAALDLGVIGNVGMVEEEGITEIQEMRAQVGAAKEAGLTKIHAYSLDGILTLENQDQWYESFQAPHRPAKEQSTVNLIRSLFQLLDRLL